MTRFRTALLSLFSYLSAHAQNDSDPLPDLTPVTFWNFDDKKPGSPVGKATLQNSTLVGPEYPDFPAKNTSLHLNGTSSSDADADGASNILEYATGTDPLDSASKSDFSLSLENLGRGLEPVFSFRMALEPDDVFLYPSTSTDLSTWSPAVLELVDASPLSNETATWVRFRLAQLDGEKARFFRAESGME